MLFPAFNIFVDGGGNNRFFLEKYLNRFPEFNKIYVFEPNPLFYNSYNQSNFLLVKKAIWTSDCKMPFYLSNDERQVGSSLIKNKMCRVKDNFCMDFQKNSIEVDCLDFSNWVKKNIKNYYNFTLKLDIEGAEYDVLWKMIKDETIYLVKNLYVEFHKDHLNIEKEDHVRLIQELEKKGIIPKIWD